MKLYYKYILISIVSILIGYGGSFINKESESNIYHMIDKYTLFCNDNILYGQDVDFQYEISNFQGKIKDGWYEK